MPAVLLDSQGRVLSNGTGCYVTDDVFINPTYTGTVDREGLTALGWDSDDIAWLQAHVWWNKEDNDYWKVTEANLAFGPNGSTPLTWATRTTIKENPDVRYFPKFDPSPSSNTSWSSLFSGYWYLYAIPTHGWNTSKVTTFYNLFYNCYCLCSVGDLTNWSTAALTSTALQGTFNGCWNLSDIGNLSNWTTNNVTSFNGLFSTCYKLKSVKGISNWNTAKVTNMTSVFNGCHRIEDVGDLSNWDVSKVTTFSTMFASCYNLKHITGLKNWNTGACTSLASMFSNCYNLRYIDDLTNWNVSNVTSLSSTFYLDYSLLRIGNLSNWNISKLTNLYNTFASCMLLSNIGDLSRWDTSKVNGTSTSTGFVSTFTNCYSLRNVGTFSGWSMAGMTGTKNQMNSLFSNCYNIEKLDVKNWDVSKVINFTYTFSGMRKLVELDVSGWDLSANTNSGTSAATSIFANMQQLRILKLGSKFFNGTPTTYYFSHLTNWTRDSIIESLYTNQTLRTSSSTLITIQIGPAAFDRLKNDLPTGFTLTNTTTIMIDSKNIKLVRT